MGFVADIFGLNPKMPAVQPAPPAPKLADVDPAPAPDDRERRGRASTILAGRDEEEETVGGSRMLLGAGY